MLGKHENERDKLYFETMKIVTERIHNSRPFRWFFWEKDNQIKKEGLIGKELVNLRHKLINGSEAEVVEAFLALYLVMRQIFNYNDDIGPQATNFDYNKDPRSSKLIPITLRDLIEEFCPNLKNAQGSSLEDKVNDYLTNITKPPISPPEEINTSEDPPISPPTQSG